MAFFTSFGRFHEKYWGRVSFIKKMDFTTVQPDYEPISEKIRIFKQKLRNSCLLYHPHLTPFALPGII
jgi:hypothetical protein